jgi:hypothetical protein
MCKEKAVFYPREDITEIYERYYEVYKELYPTLIPIFAKMAEKLPHL